MPIKPRRKLTAKERRDLDIEIGFMERLVRRDPHYVEALQVLSADYAKRGQYDDGLKVDRKLARLAPTDSTVLYNFACTLSLTKRIKQAATALHKALDCGFEDYRMILRDPDLANLRRDPIFDKIRIRIIVKETR